MRRVRYGVGMSLDGYIAGPGDTLDWMISDPAYDQGAFFRGIDTVLMGRRSYEVALRHGGGSAPGMRSYVFSTTLAADEHPDVVVVSADDAAATVAALREEDGKDIWLAGGGVLFASLLEAGLVDTVEVGIMPALLGGGVPLLPSLSRLARLELTHSEAFPSGLVVLHYAVLGVS